MQANWASRRHDATPWQPNDSDSRKVAGNEFGLHAALLQSRGDRRGACTSLLTSQEMLLELSSDKVTWLAFAFQACNTECCLDRPYISKS